MPPEILIAVSIAIGALGAWASTSERGDAQFKAHSSRGSCRCVTPIPPRPSPTKLRQVTVDACDGWGSDECLDCRLYNHCRNLGDSA